MKKILLLSVLGILLFSCSDDDEIEQPEFAGKTFDHLYFETEQECLDAQPEPDFFMNCHQQVDFLDNENVEIMLTDIIYKTTYSINSSEIIVYSTPNTYEFQNDLIFQIINPSTLKLTRDNTIWKERTGNSPWNKAKKL